MKKNRGTGHDGEGKRLWEHVTRSVKVYGAADKKKPIPAKLRTTRKAEMAPPAPKPPHPRPAGTSGQVPSRGFDRATETKLKKGKLPLEARIDLHGMTQEEAFRALHRFILSAAREGLRTVLVITGKGGVKSEGVLKKNLPLWLEDSALAKHVLALTPAQPKDGGGGAFYVRLRKEK